MTEDLIFKTVVQTGKSEQDVTSLGKAVKDLKKGTNDLDKSNNDVSKSFAEVYGELQPLNTRLGEAEDRMYELALAGKKNTEEFKALQEQVVQYKMTLQSVDAEVDALAQRGSNLKAGLELASTVTAGYGAFQGVLAMTGVESEALAETFVKLQAVESVLMSIETLRASLEKESLLVTKAKVIWTKTAAAAEYIYATAVGSTTGAMKLLRIAMLAIPIIAIIAGIMALISALSSFFSASEQAEEQNNAVNASFARQNEALEANSRAYKRNADNKRALMVSENATAQELFEFDMKRLKDEEVMRRKNVKLLSTTLAQKKQAYAQALEEENYELAKTIKDEIKQMRDKYKSFRELDGQYAVDAKLLANKRRKEIEEENKAEQKAQEEKDKEQARKQKEYADKMREQRKAEAQKRLEEQRLLEDLLVLNIVDANARKIAQMKLQHERELSEVIEKYGKQSKVVLEMETKQANEKQALLGEISKAEQDAKDAEKAKEQERLKEIAETDRKNRKAELEGKLIEMREDFDAQIQLKKELALVEMEEALAQENLTEGEKYKIKQEYAQKIDELNEEMAVKEKERQKQVQEAGKQVLQMGLEASQNLADAFFDWKIGKAEKGSAEELALEKKKFEVNKKLQIAQAIMQGVQAVQAAYASGSAIPIVGAVTGPLFAAAAGVASALNIAKIKNTTFEGGGSPSTSTPTASAPSVDAQNVMGQDSQEVVTQTKGLQGSDPEQNVTKVVLVDSELKASMSQNQQVDIVSSVG